VAATKAYDWLKTLQSELVDKKDLTYSVAPQAFAWEVFSEQLGSRFDLQDLIIQSADPLWSTEEQVRKQAGRSAWPLSFALGNLPGLVTFYLSKEDVGVLLTIALSHQPKGTLYPDEEFLEAFYHFLAVEVMTAMSKSGFDTSIAPRLVHEPAPAAEGKVLHLDISISTTGRVFQAQIMAPEEFVLAWNEKFKAEKQQTGISNEVADRVELIVHLEAGEARMTQQELAQIRQGDFLLLDSCSLAPDQPGGQVTLTAKGIPLFRGLLQSGQIKIVEYPLFQKMGPSMDDEDFQDTGSTSEQTPVEKMANIPISIKVEVGQVRMTLAKLMELQPGAVLELNVDPEEGVDLVVNGKCIGKGELLRLGETLGVRIVEIG